MATLQIREPGSWPVKIDLSQRWGADNTVVVGVARQDIPENHIAFRKANGYLSRRQVTILAPDGNADKLMIRDGGKEPSGQWSREWKHTFINDVPLSHTDWRAFGPGDRIRFHTEKPPLAGYTLELSIDTTDSTRTGSETVHFDVVQVWQAISRNSSDGTLLLSVPYNDGIAIIQRLDQTAEAILGSDPGELISAQEVFVFNNLVPFGAERKRLTDHISEAMVQNQSVSSDYAIDGKNVHLRLELRSVNGHMPLIGWVSLNVEPQKAMPTDWKTAAVQWANDHPWLASVVSVVIVIGLIVIKVLMG